MLAPGDIADFLQSELGYLSPGWLVDGDLDEITEFGDIVEISSTQRRKLVSGGADGEGPKPKSETLNNLPSGVLSPLDSHDAVMSDSLM